MLTTLGEKLQGVFNQVRGYGKLTESNISEALKEVRLALLAADVNYRITRDFCERVKEKALGEKVQQSIRPGDLFVKIVHDELIDVFQSVDNAMSRDYPLGVAMCGLNGAGKTTSSAKLALYYKKKLRKSVLLVAADLSRPAAVQQLETLGREIEVPVFAPSPGIKLLEHIRAAKEAAREQRADVIIYDTAGRTEVNEELLEELRQVMGLVNPQECLLVADAAMGQASVEVATQFQSAAPLTGLVLSKFDGDARGGAALSLQTVSGCPIKFLGAGERVDALEEFDPSRLVSRLLGMGDVVGLVEKAQEELDLADAARLEEKIRKQSFDFQDFLNQMRQIKKLGPIQNLLGMMPGMGNIAGSSVDDKAMGRVEAIVLSMTLSERKRPEILNANRRRRIAQGSGTSVQEVNDLLRRFKMMKKMMTKLTKGGFRESKLKRMLGGLGFS